jgi:hypothetical protein
MELICAKYGDKMSSKEAKCQHPEDYCKFRSSCMIYFIGREKERENRQSENE